MPETLNLVMRKATGGIWNDEHDEELTTRTRSKNDHLSGDLDAPGKVFLYMMLNFFEFDSLAAELDLRISAPNQLDLSIRIVSGKVSCSIEPPILLGWYFAGNGRR
jgi:hypothetical protein